MTAEVAAPVRGRRRWPFVLVVLVVLTVAGMLHSPVFSVSEIEIRGADRAEVTHLVEETGVGEGAILVWVDTGRIAAAVATDPWVRDVRVDRAWPNRIVVQIAEHEPVAWIEGVVGWMLVSADGTVLETASRPGPGLLRAALVFADLPPGSAPTDPTWAEIVQMARVIEQPLASAIVLEYRGSEVWTEVRGHDIRLGNPIDLADKGRTLQAMLADGIPPGMTLDLVSPRRPALSPPPNPQGEVEGESEET